MIFKGTNYFCKPRDACIVIIAKLSLGYAEYAAQIEEN
jgi:hypothetical protein